MFTFLDFAPMFGFQDFLQTFLEKFRHQLLGCMWTPAMPTRRSWSDSLLCMVPSTLRCYRAWSILSVEPANVLDYHKHQDLQQCLLCLDSLVIDCKSIASGSEIWLAPTTASWDWSTWPRAFSRQFAWMTMALRRSMKLWGWLGFNLLVIPWWLRVMMIGALVVPSRNRLNRQQLTFLWFLLKPTGGLAQWKGRMQFSAIPWRSWLMSMRWPMQVALIWFSLQPFKQSTAQWRAKEDHPTRQFLEDCPVFQVISLVMKELYLLEQTMCLLKNFVHKHSGWLQKHGPAVWFEEPFSVRRQIADKKQWISCLAVWRLTGDGLRKQKERNVVATSWVVCFHMIQMGKVHGSTMATVWCKWPMSNFDRHLELRIGHHPHKMFRFSKMEQPDFNKTYGKMKEDLLHHRKNLWMLKCPSRTPSFFNNYQILQCPWSTAVLHLLHLHHSHFNFPHYHRDKNYNNQQCTHLLSTRPTLRTFINIFNNNLSIQTPTFQWHQHDHHDQDHHHHYETVNLLHYQPDLLYHNLCNLHYQWKM